MNSKLTVLLVVGLAVVIGVGLLVSTMRNPAQPASVPSSPSPRTVAAGPVVRDDSHRLSTAADGKVTLVEFLDFECESCRAVYPVVEQLRQKYDGRVTFVARYFPLEGHHNSHRAARAVEAAAQQGKFEAMYARMFDTQEDWGEQKVPMDDLFRRYATDLGLDLAQFDADYSSAKVASRIQIDIDDGHALGVQSTPTFFLNGELLAPRSAEDLTRALDEALSR